MIQYFFSVFAMTQGCLVLGLTIFIFGYYLPKTKDDLRNAIRWHIIIVASSYICLTFTTVKTAAYGFYEWGDIWYWIVTFAYVSGDVSLVLVFRDAVKRKRANKLNDDQSKK